LTLSLFVSQIIFASPGHEGGHENEEILSGSKNKYPVVSVSKTKALKDSIPKIEAIGKIQF